MRLFQGVSLSGSYSIKFIIGVIIFITLTILAFILANWVLDIWIA